MYIIFSIYKAHIHEMFIQINISFCQICRDILTVYIIFLYGALLVFIIKKWCLISDQGN